MPNETDEETGPAIDGNQSEKDRQAAARSKRRRLSAWAAGLATPIAAGVVVLILNKGFDLWVSPSPVRAAPVSASSTGSTTSPMPEGPALTTTPLVGSTAQSTLTAPAPGLTTTTRGTPTQQQPPRAADPTLLASGHATIVNVDGFDLDNGQKADQNVPGMDVSPDNAVTLINAMSYGTPRMAALPRTNPASYERCQQINPDAYVQQFKDIRLMHAGDHICVHTNLGNCGVLTLTRIPSDADRNVDFDYATWDTFCRRP